MIRSIIEINQELCNGCGLCVSACHEGAIGLVNGKAQLLRDDYCDGLGDCLPACPVDAISFVRREAAAYDEAAVLENAAKKQKQTEPLPCGCPGSLSRSLISEPAVEKSTQGRAPEAPQQRLQRPSELAQWPVEIKLVPPSAPYFSNADILIAADCTAFAYADFHRDFMRGKVTLIGCPKLDGVDYAEKLTAIFTQNDINSITVARMEVPCCGGLEHAVRSALETCGKEVPFEVRIISTQGNLL